MEFLNPWGLLSLVCVPALVALYVLKQKHKELKIPSLLLWQKTVSAMEAATPWQKLKKSLLFILQLLLIICVCLAVARPAVSGNNIYDEVIIVIDSSASMNASSDGKTNFEKAVSAASKLAEGLKRDKKMSVIFAGDTAYPAVSHSQNSIEIKKALADYTCGFAGSDLENACLLAESMLGESSNGMIVLYTDSNVTVENMKNTVEVVNLAEGGHNAAIINISCALGDNGYTVMSTVKSYGEDFETTLELYTDGILTDAQNVKITADEPLSVYWKNVSSSGKIATVKMTGTDILKEDNEISITLSKSEEKKVALISESSFFIEKILNAIGKYQIFKFKASDYENGEINYDLYIFDSFVPDTFPENGAIWLINPDKSTEGITVGTDIEGTYLNAADTKAGKSLCDFVNANEIIVSKFKDVSLNREWETAINCGLLPAVAVKSEDNGRYFTLFTFDIHNSNLPLLKEFPILTQNILNYMMPELTDGNGLFLTGSEPEIRALAYSTEVSITDTEGKVTKLAPPFPVSGYVLEKPGVYEVTQLITVTENGEKKTEEIKGYLCASVPESESSMAGQLISGDNTVGKTSALKGQRELWIYLVILAFLFMLAEWWVYFREY